jgi:hypothetical protein
MNLPEQVEIERGHPVVVRDAREKVHEYELAVAFASVAGLLVLGGFGCCSTLDHDHGGRATTGLG